MQPIRTILPALLTAALVAPTPPASAAIPSCETGTLDAVPAGLVVETACTSNSLGGISPFSYFVPQACTDANRCPVLYLLHGFNGTHRTMLGTPGAPSAFVRALTQDPISGADLPDLDFILVAPHGRTVTTTRLGAPAPDVESFWVDWNARYWDNPPLFEGFVVDDLRGFVDRSLPSIATREGRAIDGVSLGGFGSFKLALQHPDLYASAGSISGALNVLVAPGPQPVGPDETGLGGFPTRAGYARPPRVARTPPFFPFGDPFGAFGDPVADEAYYRGNNPLDLAVNARGLALRFIHNDTVPRDPADLGDPASYIGAQALEAVVLPMNLEFRAALEQNGNSDFHHAINPGLHSGRYWDPHIRSQLESHWARVSHPGDPMPPQVPASFRHRSIRWEYLIWGWEVTVEDRSAVEFMTMWDASHDGVTLFGSGYLQLTTPAWGATGVRVEGANDTPLVELLPGGRMRISFDLGRTVPTDEHAGASGLPPASHAARVCLAYEGAAPSCD